jgi:hypothetical protein
MNNNNHIKRLLRLEREVRETDATLEDLSPAGHELSGNVLKSRQLNAQRLLEFPAAGNPMGIIGFPSGMGQFQRHKDAVIARDTMVTLHRTRERKKKK